MVLFALGVLGSLLKPVVDQDIVDLVDVQVDVEVLVYMKTRGHALSTFGATYSRMVYARPLSSTHFRQLESTLQTFAVECFLLRKELAGVLVSTQ